MKKCNENSAVSHRSQRAFTLVEMLVVITIISILLAAGAAVMRSGTEASSVRAGADTMQSLTELARGAAIGRSTEARLMIANNPSDDDRYLRMVMVVVAEVEDSGTPNEKWYWKPVGEAKELPGGVYYVKGTGDTFGESGGSIPWELITIPDARMDSPAARFGNALKTDYSSGSNWISIVFDGNGRVVNPGLTGNPVLVVNRGVNDGSTITTPEPFKKYAEGFVIIRSTGRPVRLESTYEQANLGN